MRVKFEEVSLKVVRKFIDSDGKKRQITKKFFQTVNPFNTNKDGTVKDRDQIMAELKASRDEWVANGGFNNQSEVTA